MLAEIDNLQHSYQPSPVLQLIINRTKACFSQNFVAQALLEKCLFEAQKLNRLLDEAGIYYHLAWLETDKEAINYRQNGCGILQKIDATLWLNQNPSNKLPMIGYLL